MGQATAGSLPVTAGVAGGKHPGKRHALRGDSPATPRDPPDSAALSASVLVLNRLYMAVHVIGVRRAFGLLFRDLAEVIHLEDGRFNNYDFGAWREMSELRVRLQRPYDDWIRAVNFEIQVPRVIRLLEFDRLPKQHLHLNRRNILARDEHRCQYCARHFPAHQLSIDHVQPRSRGGLTTWENLVCACLACNIRKGGRTPQEAKMKLVRHPFKPKRNPLLALKLENPKYESWKTWLESAHWNIGSRE
jgi:5-methylcytosine-specific restriction endonuclease McrA